MVDSTKIQHRCIPVSQVIFSRHRTSHAYSRNRVDSKNPPSNRLTQEALPSCAVHVHFAGPIGMLLSQDMFFQVSECFIFHHPLLFEKLRKNHRQTITYKSTKETPTADWPNPPSTLDPPPCPVARSARFHLKAVDSPCFGSLSTTLMKQVHHQNGSES